VDFSQDIFLKQNIMETLLKIIEEKMLLIEQLEAKLIEAQKEIEYQQETKFTWYKKFTELENTLKENQDA
jgi:hypothetical protein